jgi:uncharacterized Rmd1/YagE family protein
MKNKYKLLFSESVQTVFVMIITSFVLLTLINIFFRGMNMQLKYPWGF